MAYQEINFLNVETKKNLFHRIPIKFIVIPSSHNTENCMKNQLTFSKINFFQSNFLNFPEALLLLFPK